jgi:hypothetical protein
MTLRRVEHPRREVRIDRHGFRTPGPGRLSSGGRGAIEQVPLDRLSERLRQDQVEVQHRTRGDRRVTFLEQERIERLQIQWPDVSKR